MIIVNSKQPAGSADFYPLLPYDDSAAAVRIPASLLAEAKYSYFGTGEPPALYLISASSSEIVVQAGSAEITLPINPNASVSHADALGFLYLVYGDCADDILSFPTTLAGLETALPFVPSASVRAVQGVSRLHLYSETPAIPAYNCELPAEMWVYTKTAPDLSSLDILSGLNAAISSRTDSIRIDVQEGAGQATRSELTHYTDYSSSNPVQVGFNTAGCTGAVLRFGGALSDSAGNIEIAPSGGATVTGDAENHKITIRI